MVTFEVSRQNSSIFIIIEHKLNIAYQKIQNSWSFVYI